jgi:hypothetical protein
MSAKLRVLIVDDSKSLRTMIRGFIEDYSEIEIYEAGDGEDADVILQEKSALQEPIDLVFLDWMMPKVSGFALLQKIREMGGIFQQPIVVMLTAETYADQINACVKYGVAKYITKPFTKDDVRATVEDLLVERGLRHAV